MDVKKSVVIAIGIIVVAAIVLAIAAVAFDLISGNLAGEPTPGPTVTPAPSGSATPSPGPTTGATPGASPGAATGERVYAGAILNRTSGMCLVTIMLNRDATPVDTSRLGMDVECNGQTYRNVWSPEAFDWAGSDGDALLEFGEALSPQIDTAGQGIPQDQPITIIILLDRAELQRVTVTPT
ncbi:MAG: hypothetical protein A4E28_00651 [Methanocella sp. PtaU1.Bin125]|nr:MAG: hypothetical protein A4E28_00651 [Methanocella sp. PtaU1.Bin125]